MKKEINIPIRLKILKEENILALNDYIFDVYQNMSSEHKSFDVNLRCEGNQTYKFNDESLRKNENILKIKKVTGISISFHDYKAEKRVRIEMSHGSIEWNNYYSVEGADEAWVNDVSIKLQDYFLSFASQRNIVKYFNALLHIFSILIGYFIVKLLFFLLHLYGYAPDCKTVDLSNPFSFLLIKLAGTYPYINFIYTIFVYWFAGFLVCAIFWFGMFDFFNKTWPSVEFDFGPEHQNLPRRRRNIIFLIITLILLPLLLQAIPSCSPSRVDKEDMRTTD